MGAPQRGKEIKIKIKQASKVQEKKLKQARENPETRKLGNQETRNRKQETRNKNVLPRTLYKNSRFRVQTGLLLLLLLLF